MKNKKILPLLLLLFLFIAYCLVSIASPRATDYEADLREKIDSELAKGAKVVITASRSSTSTTTTITGTVTNVYSDTLENLVINGMTFKDRGEIGVRYSVLDIFNENKEVISSLVPNASINFTLILENINWEANLIHGVVFVQEENTEKKEVLQALYID
jgi:hypothetical protein